MACFLAPTAAVIITTSIKKKISPKYHLGWLNTMLWGGVMISMIEHFIHKEIVPYPPFLTAMQNPANIPVMLREIATVGGAMTITIIAIWAVMVLIANKTTKFITKKNYKPGFLSLILFGGIIMILVDYFYATLSNIIMISILLTLFTTLLISKLQKSPIK